MSLEIARTEREGIQIVSLIGQLTLGPEDLAFRAKMALMMSAGENRVLFNLSELSALDSAGAGTLLSTLKKLRTAGGNGAICNMNPLHLGLLVEARLEIATEVFSTEQDAVESFFADKGIRHYDVLDFVEGYRRKHPTIED